MIRIPFLEENRKKRKKYLFACNLRAADEDDPNQVDE
jgi:hypothetical protein